jgi:tyrosinase
VIPSASHKFSLNVPRNIDRLFAIWQALNEDDGNVDSWVTPKPTDDGSWTQVSGDIETIDTHLYPFRPTEDSWYDSRIDSGKTSMRRTEPFGYTYPETAGLKYPVSSQAKATLYNTVQTYYTNLPRLIRESKANNPKAGDFLLPQVALLSQIAEKKVTASHTEAVQLASAMPKPEALFEESVGPEKPFLRDLAPDNEYLEWLVNISAERHAASGNYSVHVFLDAVEEDNVALWPMSPHHVGSFAPFGQASNTICGNCKGQQESRLEITSQIPLTIALVERYLAQLIPDLSKETVVPYLTENLHWRVEIVSNCISNSNPALSPTIS